ncbi:MAG: S8 family serine peptidase [Alphaproteobacteria bacterium]|jgi:hypothetical protein|nr:S8 family serine peptidase [Alphaproteobacteria bacterium]MDP6566614.1 S8 family serine peptidase [Alphaproteobacteria bacterium]MDP6815042.1 S8 family serine peptidase [Alphaproteobacteria bacterium]
MTDYKLRYGRRYLELRESRKFIGVRPKPGRARAMDDAIVAISARKADLSDGGLGGFEVVEVTSETEESGQVLDRLRLDNSVKVGTHVFHTSDDDVPFVPTGELFVVFRQGASDDEKRELLGDQRLELVEARDGNEFIVRVTKAARNPIRVAHELQRSEAVEIAEPELATLGQLTARPPSADTLIDEQWHLRNTGRHRGDRLFFKPGADARVVDAWQRLGVMGSPDTVVAVIDDGFDLTHPDLRGNERIVHPYDFTRKNAEPKPGWGDWHGTACARVAIGRPGRGDIAGAAPGATVMPVRWGRNLADREIEDWFGHVTRNGADVVSCSWGAAADVFELSTRAYRAIEKCARDGRGGKGCVVVFAAGNDNHDINDPPHSVDGFAIHPDVIAVASCTSRDEKSNCSNFGVEIWIAAPSSGAGGAGIVTAGVMGHVAENGTHYHRGYAAGDYTYDFGGTSSACPLVAGICALILTANPDLTSAEVKDILRDTARRIGNGAGYDRDGHSEFFGHGCVDADSAVARALELIAPDEDEVGYKATA